MAIESVGSDGRDTESASVLIRERARVAVATAAERTDRAERGIGDAGSVEISAAARNRAGLGSAVARTETAIDRVPPPRRSRGVPEVGQPPPPPPKTKPGVADIKRRELRRREQANSGKRGSDRAVGRRNRIFRDQTAETRAQVQLERSERTRREREA